MTRQEAFDIMVKHLRQQGCRAISNGVCRYRGDHGTKCAVGALITDEQHEIMRHTAYQNGVGVGIGLAIPLIGMHPDDRDFLRTVQVAHDHVPIEDWDERLREIAVEYNLTYPELEVSHVVE